MQSFSVILAAFASAAFISFLITLWALRLCHRFCLYDLPSERKLHTGRVPRLGGMAFVPAVAAGLCCGLMFLRLQGEEVPQTMRLSTLLIGGGALLIYVAGLADDIIGLSAWHKLPVQTIAALTFPLSGLYIDNLGGFCGIGTLPLPTAYVLTVVTALLIINALNFIDGVDGLAGSLSLLAMGAYCLLFSELNVIAFTLLAASFCGVLCVFLLFNLCGTARQHTKTFMGDSGSLTLGLALAYLTTKYAMQDSPTLPPRPDGLLMAYTLPLVPCLDLCRVALRRLMHRTNPFRADRTHLHHKILQAGFTPLQTLVAIIGLQLAYLALNISMSGAGLSLNWIVPTDVLTFALINLILPTPPQPRKDHPIRQEKPSAD